jgi:hypothetical protein
MKRIEALVTFVILIKQKLALMVDDENEPAIKWPEWYGKPAVSLQLNFITDNHMPECFRIE